MSHLENAFFVWAPNRPELAADADPDELAKLDPDWAQEIRVREPWREVPAATPGRWWRASAPAPMPIALTGRCSTCFDLAQELYRADRLPIWASVLSASQWAGRGQVGRNWISPPGNLYAAWRLPPPPPPWRGFMSLLLGHALRTELAARGLDLQIKWPNDLWLEGRKLGGILVVEKAGAILAGIGINVASRPADVELRSGRAASAICLAEAGLAERPVGLWASLADGMRATWQAETAADTPAHLARRMEECLAFLRERAMLVGSDGNVRRIRLLGLAANGGLRVQDGEAEETIHSGSLLPEPT